MFAAGRVYNVTVTAANLTESQQKGTPGIFLSFEDEKGEGHIGHTIWLVPKTKERAEKDLATLGVTPEILKSASFWSSPESVLVGKECSITTYEDDFGGRKTVKVQWINPRKSGGGDSLVSRAASLFGVAVEDDEVPF